jgi:hypothetical protein
MASQSYALRGRPSRACIPRSVASAASTSHHTCLRGAVVVHLPLRSAVAPPQPLPPHRRAHLKGSLPRVAQGDAVALVPPGIHRCGRCHLAVVRTSWGHRRVLALGIRCRNCSHLADVRAGLRDPPPRACPPDPPSRACPLCKCNQP